jgi:hypothetical protein
MELILVILLVGLAWLWLRQFVWMMSLEDDSFPGTFDKLIWGLVFVFLSPIAPLAFIVWKRTAVELRKGFRLKATLHAYGAFWIFPPFAESINLTSSSVTFGSRPSVCPFSRRTTSATTMPSRQHV